MTRYRAMVVMLFLAFVLMFGTAALADDGRGFGEGFEQVTETTDSSGGSDAAATTQDSVDDPYRWIANHTRAVFWTQYVYGLVIFVIAIAVLVVGIVLCIRQFNLTPGSESESEFSFSVKDGIRVRSKFIGFMILVVSLVFFYLFLRFVFEIGPVDLFGDQGDQTAQAVTQTTG